MTYEEFRKIVEDTDSYSINENSSSLYVTWANCSNWSIRISKDVGNYVQCTNQVFRKEDYDLIRAALKLAETPLDKREPEKRYFLRHKFLITELSNERAYLVFKNDVYYAGLPIFFKKQEAQFTKKEIEEIKNKYDVTLEDFEMVEVKDE